MCKIKISLEKDFKFWYWGYGSANSHIPKMYVIILNICFIYLNNFASTKYNFNTILTEHMFFTYALVCDIMRDTRGVTENDERRVHTTDC